MRGEMGRRFGVVRLRKRSALATGLVLGLVLLTGQPALAVPFWQPFTETSAWDCKRISSESSIANVQICVVVNGQAAQAVATVRNDTSSGIEIVATLTSRDDSGPVSQGCFESALGARLKTACFGTTINGDCGEGVLGAVTVGVRRAGVVRWSDAAGEMERTYCS